MIFRIFPGQSLSEICIQYHDKGDPRVKQMVDAGISVIEGAEPRLNPPSCVQKETQQGWQVSFKVAFLPEPQVTALCEGIPPDALNVKGLKKVSIKITDGTLCNGYLLSYVGLPQDIRDSAHEVQIFRSSGFQHQELYMPAANQLVPQQAANTWHFLTAADLKGRVDELKNINSATHLSTVKKDAERVLEERQKQEENPVKQEPGEGAIRFRKFADRVIRLSGLLLRSSVSVYPSIYQSLSESIYQSLSRISRLSKTRLK